MGFGIGLVMTAAGAILIWAVNVDPTSHTVNVHAVGWVLLILGIVGMALSLIFWSSWAGPGRISGRRRTVVDSEGRVTEERTASY